MTNTTKANRALLNATIWIRFFVTSGPAKTIQATYAELAKLGFAGDRAEDVLDAAAITVTATQVCDLSPVVFYAVAE